VKVFSLQKVIHINQNHQKIPPHPVNETARRRPCNSAGTRNLLLGPGLTLEELLSIPSTEKLMLWFFGWGQIFSRRARPPPALPCNRSMLGDLIVSNGLAANEIQFYVSARRFEPICVMLRANICGGILRFGGGNFRLTGLEVWIQLLAVSYLHSLRSCSGGTTVSGVLGKTYRLPPMALWLLPGFWCPRQLPPVSHRCST
jgi:hypothetical protein